MNMFLSPTSPLIRNAINSMDENVYSFSLDIYLIGVMYLLLQSEFVACAYSLVTIWCDFQHCEWWTTCAQT